MSYSHITTYISLLIINNMNIIVFLLTTHHITLICD